MRSKLLVIAVLLVGAAFAAEPDDCPRDLSGLDLAWLGDPRAAADMPGDLGRPMSRRAARRARRAARGWRIAPPETEPAPAASTETIVDQSAADESDTRYPAERGFVGRDGFAAEGGNAVEESVAERPRVRRIRDLPYVEGGHARQRFDLFLPANHASEPLPLVIWIHGTNWRDGSKDDCPITWLVDKGYAVASVGYRLTDTAVFPAQLQDCLEAVDHLQARAAAWNLDPSRFAIAGSAAGGHLAALVGLAEERVADPGRPKVRGVCVVSAPTLLTALGPTQDRAGSPASLLVGGPLPEFREAAQRASPLTHVTSDAPPFLIIHTKGVAGDPSVPTEQSRQFDEALRAAGATSTLVVIDRQSGKSPLAAGSRTAETLVEFLERSLDRPGDG